MKYFLLVAFLFFTVGNVKATSSAIVSPWPNIDFNRIKKAPVFEKSNKNCAFDRNKLSKNFVGRASRLGSDRSNLVPQEWIDRGVFQLTINLPCDSDEVPCGVNYNSSKNYSWVMSRNPRYSRISPQVSPFASTKIGTYANVATARSDSKKFAKYLKSSFEKYPILSEQYFTSSTGGTVEPVTIVGAEEVLLQGGKLFRYAGLRIYFEVQSNDHDSIFLFVGKQARELVPVTQKKIEIEEMFPFFRHLLPHDAIAISGSRYGRLISLSFSRPHKSLSFSESEKIRFGSPVIEGGLFAHSYSGLLLINTKKNSYTALTKPFGRPQLFAISRDGSVLLLNMISGSSYVSMDSPHNSEKMEVHADRTIRNC